MDIIKHLNPCPMDIIKVCVGSQVYQFTLLL